MKKLLSILFLIIIYQTGFSQTDSSQIALGIAPLSWSSQVSNQYPGIILGVIAQEASKMQYLHYVDRSPDIIRQVDSEITGNQDPKFLNSQVLAKAGVQMGATYIFTGDVSEVSISRVPTGKEILGVKVIGRLVTVIVTFHIINVSTGESKAKQFKSNLVPAIDPRPDDRIIADKIQHMGNQFHQFLQDWYNQTTGTSPTKTN